jgi:hypothetical protein
VRGHLPKLSYRLYGRADRRRECIRG